MNSKTLTSLVEMGYEEDFFGANTDTFAAGIEALGFEVEYEDVKSGEGIISYGEYFMDINGMDQDVVFNGDRTLTVAEALAEVKGL